MSFAPFGPAGTASPGPVFNTGFPIADALFSVGDSFLQRRNDRDDARLSTQLEIATIRAQNEALAFGARVEADNRGEPSIAPSGGGGGLGGVSVPVLIALAAVAVLALRKT